MQVEKTSPTCCLRDSAYVTACGLTPKCVDCQTDGLLLTGAHDWTPTMYIRLVQDFGLDCEVAQHLAKSYGDRAFAVAKMASLTGKVTGKRHSTEMILTNNSRKTLAHYW